MAKTLEEIKKNFFDSQIRFEPVTGYYWGLDKYASQLRLPDEALRNEERAFAIRLLADLESYTPALLSTQNQIDVQIMRTSALWYLIRIENPGILGWNCATDISYLVNFLYYNLGRQKGETKKWDDVFTKMKMIPSFLEQQQKNIENGLATKAPFYRREVQRDGIDLAPIVSKYFQEDVVKTAEDSLSKKDFSKFAPKLKSAASEIAAAIGKYVRFLKNKVLPVSKDNAFAIGEEEYSWRLRNILFSNETPETLFTYGKRQVAQTANEMQKLANQIQKNKGLPLKPYKNVIDDIQKEAPSTDKEMFDMYNANVKRVVEFIKKNKLFVLPENYSIDLTETPEAYHNVLSVAAMNPIPPFADGIVAQFWVTPTRNAKNPNGDPGLLQENHAKAMAPNLVVHEAVPGHDLQLGFSARRFISGGRKDLSFKVRSCMPDVMSSLGVEGWAHYTEQLMAEQEFYTPEEHLFQLKDAQWRNVRIVVDTGIHTGRMSYNDAISYFDENTHSGKVTAEREIYRYSKWPLQAITYHLGKRDILNLRERVTKEMGNKNFNLAKFHELLLTYDGTPISLFEDELLSKLTTRFIPESATKRRRSH